MSFSWPLALLGLLAVPVAVVLYLTADRRRRRHAARFGTPALVAGSITARPGRRRHLPFGLALASLALLAVGLARPNATLSVTKEEATIVLAVDTSRSMAATDVRPNRLRAARAAATTFLEKVPAKYRVGIVSFSSTAQLVLSPTTDREAARAALRELRLGAGTAIGDAIAWAVDAARPRKEGEPQQPSPDDPPAAVLLLSDGAQTGGLSTPEASATVAARRGVPVSAVALGTGDAIVEVPLPGGLKERVTVTPDPQTLRAVAERTGGLFFEAPDAERLEQVYRDLGSRLARTKERREVTSAFAAAGGLLLLAGAALSTLWFRRPL